MAIFGAKIELFGPKLILKNFSGVKMVPKQVFTGAGFKSPSLFSMSISEAPSSRVKYN